MFVRSYMTPEPVCVGPAAPLRDVMRALALNGIGHLPVVNEQKHVLGILSDDELRGAADHPDFWNLRTHEIMSPSPLTIESHAPLGRALSDLCAHGAEVLLVLERGVLVGILTRTDCLRAFSQALALDTEGSSVEVAVNHPADLVTAVNALHQHGADILAAVVGRVRDDGEGPVLFVRLGNRDPRPAERALAEAGLILLVPEEEMLARD